MKSVSAESAIETLVILYKEALEDDCYFLSTQLEREFDGVITKTEYDDDNDCINFEVVNEETYKLCLPKQFKINVKSNELNSTGKKK